MVEASFAQLAKSGGLAPIRKHNAPHEASGKDSHRHMVLKECLSMGRYLLRLLHIGEQVMSMSMAHCRNGGGAELTFLCKMYVDTSRSNRIRRLTGSAREKL